MISAKRNARNTDSEYNKVMSIFNWITLFRLMNLIKKNYTSNKSASFGNANLFFDEVRDRSRAFPRLQFFHNSDKESLKQYCQSVLRKAQQAYYT